MININDVIGAFEQGEISKENGNFLIAARYYRIASVALPHCELPPRSLAPADLCQKIDKVCDNVCDLYDQMYHLLTQEQRMMLRSEESSRRRIIDSKKNYYEWMWEDLVSYDYSMICRELILRNNPDYPKYVF